MFHEQCTGRGSKALSEYRASLEQEMEQHKREKQAASDNRFKIESENAAREINKALSAEHLHIKRKLSKKQQALKEKLFAEVEDLLKTFAASRNIQTGWKRKSAPLLQLRETTR